MQGFDFTAQLCHWNESEKPHTCSMRHCTVGGWVCFSCNQLDKCFSCWPLFQHHCFSSGLGCWSIICPAGQQQCHVLVLLDLAAWRLDIHSLGYDGLMSWPAESQCGGFMYSRKCDLEDGECCVKDTYILQLLS